MINVLDKNSGWGFLPLALLMAACGTDPAGPATTSRVKADPSAFFAGELPAYARDLDGTSQSTLLVLRAIRRADPCGLVPKDDLAKSAPPLVKTAPADTLDSCKLSFADDGAGESFEVGLVPDADRSPGEEYFEVDGQAVYQGRSGDLATCSFFFDSGLAKYPGAPRDVPDAKIQVRAYRHDNPCGLANSVTTAIVKAKPISIPLRAVSEKILDQDPCAVVADEEKAKLDFADTTAYRCGLVSVPDERSLWAEFRRLPEKAVAPFQTSKEGDVPVWTDPAATPLAQVLAAVAPPPPKGAAPGKRLPATPAAKPKAPTGPRCTAYVKASEPGQDPAASPAPGAPQPAANEAEPVYVVVSGQIDCAQAKHLAGEAARRVSQ
ncbi:MAG: hypothetical protein ACRC20_09250 [Segniliparus sp.]|uniref:hypothetical protein n=1 Tax=Segniliparus sp. TaxID=2804064 RepID=UPI003F3D2D58